MLWAALLLEYFWKIAKAGEVLPNFLLKSMAPKTTANRNKGTEKVGASGLGELGYDNMMFSSLEAQQRYTKARQRTLISERKVEFTIDEEDHEIFYGIKYNVRERQ